MKMKSVLVLSLLLGLYSPVYAQETEGKAASVPSAAEYSGMYTFLQEGEFVQVTVEDTGRVTGFVSRYGNLESDKGAFLDQFFKEAKLDGGNLTFTTQTVHGVWFDFKGIIERGEGKARADEAYFVIRGTLVQNLTDSNKKVSSRSREVTFKSFPQDLGAPSARKN